MPQRARKPTPLARLAFAATVVLSVYVHVQLAFKSSALNLEHGKTLDLVTQTLSQHPRILTLLAPQVGVIAALLGLFFWVAHFLGRSRTDGTRWYQTDTAGFLLTWASMSWLLIRQNSLWFPHSTWSWVFLPATSAAAAPAVDLMAGAWLLWRLLATARDCAARLARNRARQRMVIAAFSLLVVGLGLSTLSSRASSATASASPARAPNVVVIGLDSLQRGIAMQPDQALMPHLAGFRSQAFVQSNVVSPLARTFPAWVTILTGEHPQQSGARFNLAGQRDIDAGRSLAHTLKQQGYRTVYATDETRFSNVGRAFGFDAVLSPPAGVPDYLLGQFGDQPLVNFAVQLPYAETLLPSLVGNRAFAQAYRPQRFVERLARGLGPATAQPTFLAVHLCLAHWPYFSAGDPAETGYKEHPYYAAVRELDGQFGSLLARLRRLGYIDEDSIVIVLADHGEGTDRTDAEPKNVTSHVEGFVPVTPPGGHGATLLSPVQWQVFAMFSGKAAAGRPIRPGVSTQLASLEDIAPAILRLSGHASASPYALDVERDAPGTAASPPTGRPYVVLETGFRPANFSPTSPDGTQAMRIAESSYDIRDDGRVEMKPEVFSAAIPGKDVGVTNGRQSLVVMHATDGLFLVADDISERRWEIYPTAPDREFNDPPLLAAACAVPEMRVVISAWCARAGVAQATTAVTR